MSEDFSNYWTASLYFKSPENGTFKRIPQMANGRLNGSLMEMSGGLTVYYMHAFSGTNKNVTVFKPVREVSRMPFAQADHYLKGFPNAHRRSHEP